MSGLSVVIVNKLPYDGRSFAISNSPGRGRKQLAHGASHGIQKFKTQKAPVGAIASNSMGRTYTSLTYHLIFSTKYRLKTTRPEFRERLYQYIGGIIREKEGVLLEIGGIEG